MKVRNYYRISYQFLLILILEQYRIFFRYWPSQKLAGGNKLGQSAVAESILNSTLWDSAYIGKCHFYLYISLKPVACEPPAGERKVECYRELDGNQSRFNRAKVESTTQLKEPEVEIISEIFFGPLLVILIPRACII